MAIINPREYQLEALDAILSRKKEGVTRQLCVLPTGTGKTIVFGLLAKELNVKTIIIAHREQLIKQAVDKVSMVWPEAKIGVVMAEQEEVDAQIVVASIQSASRPQRLKRLKEQDFTLCIIDEAHHATSSSYRTLLQELGFLYDPAKLLVGVTATPSRQDRNSLGDIFEEVVFERSIGVMIRAGYLADLKGKRILTATNLDDISLNGRDFVEYQLAEVCNSPERNSLIVDSFLEHAPQRKGIAFTCDVQHAIDLAETFRKRGVTASAIYGAMADDEKVSIMSRFACGELQILANCALLTEGYDQPDISTVLMCRPTRSQSLYIQCVGRGTRLHPGKTDCLVLDFCDNFHDIQSIATLEKTVSLPSDEKTKINEGDSLIKEQKAPRTVFVGQQIVGDFDLIDRSRFAWVPVKEHWHLQLSPGISLWLKKEETGYMPTLQHDERLEPLVTRGIPLDYAMGLAEDWVRRNKDFDSWSSKDARWRNEPPTEKQIDILQKMGYNPEGITKGQAMQVISQRINERNLWKYESATAKQRFFLMTKGVQIPNTLTKGEAAGIISEIKQKEAVNE